MQCPECGQQIVKQKMEEGYDMYLCAGCGFTSRELPDTKITVGKRQLQNTFLPLNLFRRVRYLDPF